MIIYRWLWKKLNSATNSLSSLSDWIQIILNSSTIYIVQVLLSPQKNKCNCEIYLRMKQLILINISNQDYFCLRLVSVLLYLKYDHWSFALRVFCIEVTKQLFNKNYKYMFSYFIYYTIIILRYLEVFSNLPLLTIW